MQSRGLGSPIEPGQSGQVVGEIGHADSSPGRGPCQWCGRRARVGISAEQRRARHGLTRELSAKGAATGHLPAGLVSKIWQGSIQVGEMRRRRELTILFSENVRKSSRDALARTLRILIGKLRVALRRPAGGYFHLVDDLISAQ